MAKASNLATFSLISGPRRFYTRRRLIRGPLFWDWDAVRCGGDRQQKVRRRHGQQGRRCRRHRVQGRQSRRDRTKWIWCGKLAPATRPERKESGPERKESGPEWKESGPEREGCGILQRTVRTAARQAIGGKGAAEYAKAFLRNVRVDDQQASQPSVADKNTESRTTRNVFAFEKSGNRIIT